MHTKKKNVMMGIVTLAIMALLVAPGLAQEAGKGQKPVVSPQEVPSVSMKGKIVFMQSYGGYLVISEMPHEEYKILNENVKVLGALAKEGKTVEIEGTLPRGAYLLAIDKINGKKYVGDK
jgi:hypothetical protein